GEFNYHIQITPAYRRKVMEDERVTKLVKAYISSNLEELRVEIVTMKGGKDHLHIFVANCKNIAPSKLIGELKGFSSRMMRKNHWKLFKYYLWSDKFWSEGYFCRSIGATTTEAVEYYIKYSQDKHWNNLDYEIYQAKLGQF
ncbi:IS200/IS605 family transposase, partial [Candidatus Pacearchaeota archaeon]|nr:IS200/IS605 family transposase [Candidatus Pacearchaeota archaeon]